MFDAYVGLLGKWSLIEMNLQVFMFSVKVFKNEMPADDLATGVIFLKKMSEDDRSWIDTFRRTLTSRYADLRTREPDRARLVGINLDDGDESANSKATNRIDHQAAPGATFANTVRELNALTDLSAAKRELDALIGLHSSL